MLQYICASNHHTVNLKLTQCYMSIISHKIGEKKSKGIGMEKDALGWPKGSFGFFHKMALVALSCL